MKKFLILILSFTCLNLPSSFAADNTAEYLNLSWWNNFNDECLTDNLLKLYENNYDLKNAALKVKANEQIVKMQFAQELPGISFTGEAYRDFQAARKRYGNLRIPKYSQNNYYLPITASYEADIWGKNRLKTKSEKQQAEIVKQEERATYIALTSGFASDYYNLIKTDKLLELQDELVKTQEQVLNLIQNKYEIGLTPVTDVLYQQKVLNTLKEEYNSYKKIQEILINNLRVYLAVPSGDIKRESFDNVSLLKGIPEEYSSSIIENRPDYLERELNLKRIGIEVKIAKREFLPTFTIFGQIGLNSYTVSSLFHSPSQFLSAGILPNLDLFSGGRKIAMLKFQKYRYEEALNDYQKSYLDAINEINTGLIEYKTANKNYQEVQEKLNSEEKIYNLIQDNREIGNANNLDVLLSEEIYLTAQKEEVSNKIDILLSAIGLYKVVGGVDLFQINKTL